MRTAERANSSQEPQAQFRNFYCVNEDSLYRWMRFHSRTHADVLSDGSSIYTPGISSHSSTGSRFEHQDYLGTNRFETDSSQSVQGGRTYDAFGNPTSTTGSPQGPFGFGGNWG